MAIPGANSALPVTEAGTASREERRGLQWQLAAIIRIAPLSPRVMSFTFAPSQPFPFRAGQHVDIRLTAPDGYRAERSYSIASPPETPSLIELVIERIENGEVSPFFHEIAVVGDDIELRGPIGGHFVWGPDDGGPLLLIGGGSGVVPLMSMLRHRAAQDSRVPALLLFSARTWDDVIFRDELLALDARQDGFELVLTLTREPARREGDFMRRVDASMLAEVLARLPSAPRHVFVCGTNAFVEAAADSAIAAGLSPGIIRTERYGG
jgi:ferredoxin-NADP reductase